MDDNRVVLPLDKVREAAHAACTELHYCCQGFEHESGCLMPYLEERDRLLAQDAAPDGPSPDCRDTKHAACTGCPCPCHTTEVQP